MTVISIVGAPGVGKSFLVKQLAAMNKLPAFFEGELGTIPREIISAIENGDNALTLFDWFLKRDKEQLIKARKISDAGIVSFMDGSVLSSRAYIFDENPALHKVLHQLVDSLEPFEADRIVIIVANKKKIEELIKLRGRPHEQNQNAITKSLRVQDEFLRLAKNRDDVLIIDRSNLDFSNNDDISWINELIRRV